MVRKFPRVNDYADAKDSQSWPEFPGPQLDADLNATHASIDALNAFLSSVIRHGPSLKAGSVTRESVNPESLSGFPRAVFWMPFHRYYRGQTVINEHSYYFTETEHVSSSDFADDADKWVPIIGYGNGSPVTDDNFADITNKARVREILGLGSMAVHDHGDDIVEFRTNADSDARFLRRSANLADLDDPAEFLDNLGLADFTRTGRAEGMLGDRGVFGRLAGSGSVLAITPGTGLAFASGALRSAVADPEDLTPTHAGVITPAQFGGMMSDTVLSFVGGASVEGVSFGAMRLDRHARARHAPSPTDPQITLTPGGWRTRPLSEVSSIRVGASVSSNRLFLPAGAYFVECSATTYASAGPVSSRLRFKRVGVSVGGDFSADPLGADSPEVLGTCCYDGNSGGLSVPDVIRGLLVTDEDGFFELQQRVSAPVVAGSPSNLDASGVGSRELYAEVRAFRLDRGAVEDYAPFTFRDLIRKVGSASVVRTVTPQIGRQFHFKAGAVSVLRTPTPQIGRQFYYKVGAVALLEPEA